jgi:alpha-1,2-mannosyltransferase
MNYVAAAGVLSLVLILKPARYTPLLVLLTPMYIWLAVLVPRPHKEERFLFPIYPCLCLGAAMLSVSTVEFIGRLRSKTPPTGRWMLLVLAIIWAPATLLSLGRTVALSKYYTAPLTVYSHLHHHADTADSTICTCGEWYRFPSSFYLPSNIQSFGFVQSSFDGQLPQPFLPSGSKVNTVLHFNDQNRPEPASYTSIDDCDYLIDLFNSNDCRENDSIWKPLALGSFLLPTTSTLHRTLYIPGLHERDEARGLVEYVDYILYQKIQSWYVTFCFYGRERMCQGRKYEKEGGSGG